MKAHFRKIVALIGVSAVLLQTQLAHGEIPAGYQTLYQNECASCHMAYPAGLLPARSWQKILQNLDNHFGDNASLDAETLKKLQTYLQEYSADNNSSRFTRKLQRNLGTSDTPMRITELPYFKHEHGELSPRMVQYNPDVKSFSRCEACHQGAEQGNFNEHRIKIPGYGRWDD